MYIYLAVSFCVKKGIYCYFFGVGVRGGSAGRGGATSEQAEKCGVADTGSVLH